MKIEILKSRNANMVLIFVTTLLAVVGLSIFVLGIMEFFTGNPVFCFN